MYYRSGHRSVFVLAVTWAIFAFLIVIIYSSCLASYTSPTYKLSEIETFEDLANHPEYGVLTHKGSIMEIAVLVIITITITFYRLKKKLFSLILDSRERPIKTNWK